MVFGFGNKPAEIEPLLEQVQWHVWSGIHTAGEVGKYRDYSFKKTTVFGTGGGGGSCRMTRGNKKVD